jgi:DNA-binding NtrC family response regulator
MRQPESILVVSPDAMTLQGLTRALMRSGAPVASALGWTEGESRLHRLPVSVVVTDMEGRLPDELMTVRRLRAEFPHVTVIALVSLSTPEVEAARAEGLLLAVLEKPIALGQLEEAVRSDLARRALS